MIRMCLAAALAASAVGLAAAPLPQLVMKDGRHALLVDGEPFLILGAQCHNSSAWPATLPAVWRELAYLDANTLEAPVYWEQFEPAPGKFDTSVVDQLIDGARVRQLRLVLLWFGTWKNGSSHYLPLWMKAQPDRFPKMTGRDGRPVDSPSPYAKATLEADTQAFRALLRHLKAKDPDRTVILVQVENEPGTWGSVRDFSRVAEKRFAEAVPAALCAKLGLAPGKSWRESFGEEADVCFHAWSVARYIDQVAAAGKAEDPLPLYVNVALRDPLSPAPPGSYESGGATDNVIALWKAAAPHIDLVAPDIYLREPAKYRKVLDLYARADNALFVPETIGQTPFAHFFFEALGHGAIGWSPFGVDHPQMSEAQWLAASAAPDYSLAVTAQYFHLARPAARLLARLNFEGKLHAVAEESGNPRTSIPIQRWAAAVSFGPPSFGFRSEPKGNPQPTGGAIIGELGADDFLVGGVSCRVDFRPRESSSAQREYLRVEEVRVNQDALQFVRIWNGDETDWGLNFGGGPVWLHVRIRAF